MLSTIRGLSLFLIIFVIKPGDCLYCYECSSEIEFGSHDACSTGKTWYLRRVQCRTPSVCATYSFTSSIEPRQTYHHFSC
ncbi:uncharacterized protein LOC123317389 isoform X3 [Coccinella septempunctata]|uniref:uncharacterized protein LOC123317389 isoform X3 n=1 Tax=Coccinella septempunctata TaxID=41139 RepID=UPI001D06A753|nr:uncharacterized protein LOC123317389 isoform X3 [Coccinella septempunctata]